jgi:hypothetical protein
MTTNGESQKGAFNIRMRRATHPLTGRIDKTRTNTKWRERIQQMEKTLGYVICGALDRSTGQPCRNQPIEGYHRCKLHQGNPKKVEKLKDKVKNNVYPPNVGYGMNLNMFVRCRRCKDFECKNRINDSENDECVIEKQIYDDVMALREKYKIDDDILQGGMLESVAFLFIKRYRAEKAIADEGMVLKEIVGFDNKGGSFKNKKPHPLLKNLSDINRELNNFAKSLQFSPEAQNKLNTDKEMNDSANVIAGILKDAHKKRLADDE